MVAAHLGNFSGTASKNLLLCMATDIDAWVRAEALDSLSAFPCEEVLEFLKERCNSETDIMARSYAILAWSDIAMQLRIEPNVSMVFAKEKYICEQEPECKLSWCYSLYRFGCDEYLERLLSFLQDVNYQIQCKAMSLLEDVRTPHNNALIAKHIESLLASSSCEAVVSRADLLLKELKKSF